MPQPESSHSNWSRKNNQKVTDGEVLAKQVKQARELGDQATDYGRHRHARGVRGMTPRQRLA